MPKNTIQHIQNAVRTLCANVHVEKYQITFLRNTHEDTRKWDQHWMLPERRSFPCQLRANEENKLLAALHETNYGDEHQELPELEDVTRAADEFEVENPL